MLLILCPSLYDTVTARFNFLLKKTVYMSVTFYDRLVNYTDRVK